MGAKIQTMKGSASGRNRHPHRVVPKHEDKSYQRDDGCMGWGLKCTECWKTREAHTDSVFAQRCPHRGCKGTMVTPPDLGGAHQPEQKSSEVAVSSYGSPRTHDCSDYPKPPNGGKVSKHEPQSSSGSTPLSTQSTPLPSIADL